MVRRLTLSFSFWISRKPFSFFRVQESVETVETEVLPKSADTYRRNFQSAGFGFSKSHSEFVGLPETKALMFSATKPIRRDLASTVVHAM